MRRQERQDAHYRVMAKKSFFLRCSSTRTIFILSLLLICQKGFTSFVISPTKSLRTNNFGVGNNGHHDLFVRNLSLPSSSEPLKENVMLEEEVPPPPQPVASPVTIEPPPMLHCKVAKVEQFARLPVWPVWNGVFIFVISRLFGSEAAAKLEDAIGGRVCPNFFSQQEPGTEAYDTSPFIMLVHHRHSFFKFDPLRLFQSTFILPEGFPAHPHRGFITVTYFMKGGFTHRDSVGIQQKYGALRDNYKHHTQWLYTGAGILHEEMFDNPKEKVCTDQELYQLWLNVPSTMKMENPEALLLGSEEAPTVVVGSEQKEGNESETVVICGKYKDAKSTAPLSNSADIFHVRVQPGECWTHTLDPSYQTGIIYMRQGSVIVDEETKIPVHHTAYLEQQRRAFEKFQGNLLLVENTSEEDVADFLFLAGKPIQELVAAQGSMVMNTENEINQAYSDYERGYMGRPWDHKLSNEEWEDHIRQFPSAYKNKENLK